MSLLNFKKSIDLSGYTLIIPSVSVGNVPQLTTDLLITTLKLENIATVWHPGLVPSVGADPFQDQPEVICTACEMYISEHFKLAALQFRSTIEKKLALKFISDLINCLAELKLKSIYILATGFDYELHNVANKKTFYFAASSEDTEMIEKRTSAKLLERDHHGKFIVSGAGLGIKLFEEAGRRIAATLIVKYVSEGENIHDAQCYFSKLMQFIGINEKVVGALTYPSSWHYVYGAPPPAGLF